MEYAAILHKSDKNYCFALNEKHFLFRIQVKRNDIAKVILHFQDKYLPLHFMDTRQEQEMEYVCSDAYHDYFETVVEMDVVCLRYFFELVDFDNQRTFYGNQDFYKETITDIENMFDCPQNLREEERFIIPEWAKNKIFYQIFPSRFATTEQIDKELWYKAPIGHKDNLKGNLRGIIEHLDYLQELGIDVIYMTPIFRSDSSHKYDTIDYYQIDPSFGTTEDLKELVDQAHQRGLRVVLDGVFNHTSPKFFAFADIMEKEENSNYLDWYYVDGFPLTMEWGKKPNFKTFSYFGGMPKLNLSNKEVQDYVIAVATYWIRECHIDGWRLDVGDEISHAFWKRFRREIKAVQPDAIIIGEIWHYAGDFLEGDEWDTVMNYPFYKAVKALIAQESITVSEFCGKLGFLRGNLHNEVYPILLNMLDSHDTERFLHSCAYDKRKHKLAAAIMLLVQGMPMIYYGDEVGMEGGADPDCRRGMLWEEARQDKDMLAWYKQLIRLRKTCPAILYGKIAKQCADDKRQLWIVEKELDADKVVLIYHFGEQKVQVDSYQGMRNLLTNQTFDGIVDSYNVIVLSR